MEGVVHLDVRKANALINHETGRVMIIDFERASILEKTRRPPAPVVPNKRSWGRGGVEDCRAVSQPRPRQVNDILAARSMFASVER